MAFVDSKKPYLIAEVSSNHKADLKRCFDFVDSASELGFDAVKFQLFEVEKLFSKEALTAKPELFERKKWELPLDFIPRIKERCADRGIDFGCTPFHLEAVEFLKNYVDFFKIASYELLWDELIASCARTGINTIISTGMASMEEILNAVNIFKDHSSDSNKLPILMHCNSTYPMNIFSANLSAIETIRKSTNCEVGWSDHSVSSLLVLASFINWNVSHIELHIDLEGDGDEFSSGHCWLPKQLKELINYLRHIELINGNGNKLPSKEEIEESLWRADPSDGLRPLKSIRNNYEG